VNELDAARARYRAIMARLWKCSGCQLVQTFRKIYDNSMRCTGCEKLAIEDGCEPVE